jgi:hypothetical protein
MARTVKLTPTEKSAPKAKQVVAPSRLSGIRNNLPTIFGALALVAAGALAGTALAHGGFDGRDGRHPGPGMEARMDRDGDHMGGGMGPGERQGGVDLTGTVARVSPTELSITLADGTMQTVSLNAASQYFAQTTGTAADVTVGSYVLVQEALPVGNGALEVTGVAVLVNGLTDAHVHLGRPAKVTAVNGSALTLEAVTPRGVQTITVTIGANTSISRITTATNADLTAGNSVVVDLGRGTLAAESVLIVK